MNSRLFPTALLALTALLSTAGAENALQSLTVTVSPATVEIAPRPGGRRFVNLPDLDYLFLLEPRCEAGWQVGGLSLSVADSRLSFSREYLVDAVIEANLTVPAAQLAPLPVAGFCELADEAAQATGGDGTALRSTGRLAIPAALSAQAALLCESAEEKRMTYTAAALAVELECAAVETATETGQDTTTP